MNVPKPVLFGVLLIVVVASAAATDRHNKEHNIPAAQVSAAHIFRLPPGGKANPVLAENVLRAFALLEPDSVVDRNLAWVRQSDWEAEFKIMFARAVTWARETRRKSPEELYRLSHELRAHSNRQEKSFDNLANVLLMLAAKAGHEKAKHEQKEAMHKYRREWWPTDNPQVMSKAVKGDADAMVLLASRYEHGKGLKFSLAKAYYWYLRAREHGKDVAIKITVLDYVLSPAKKKQVLKWLAEGGVPAL